MSLFIPSTVAESAYMKMEPTNEYAALMLEVFSTRDVQLWSNAEIWNFVLDCYQEMMKETTESDLMEYQSEMGEMYEALSRFFDHICETSEIEDNLFTVQPNGTTIILVIVFEL